MSNETNPTAIEPDESISTPGPSAVETARELTGERTVDGHTIVSLGTLPVALIYARPEV